MEDVTDQSVTRLLVEWRGGNQQALSELTPLVYKELRKLAGSYMNRERAEHTLQATALIHEAYLRLADQNQPAWQNRSHFFGVAARVMRQILTDYARTHQAAKRGSDGPKLDLDQAAEFSQGRAAELIGLDDALNGLAAFDERKARIIEMRFFGGLSEAEVGQTLDISDRTVRRESRLAEAWLRRYMAGEDTGPAV
jgi:RNA polymerase sigma-70 factor, ECF subfamily